MSSTYSYILNGMFSDPRPQPGSDAPQTESVQLIVKFTDGSTARIDVDDCRQVMVTREDEKYEEIGELLRSRGDGYTLTFTVDKVKHATISGDKGTIETVGGG